MPGGKAFIEGVELQRMGQFDHVARYPIHWHLAGDVTGQYVKRSTVNRSFQRGITIHGVQHVLVQDNIVFDTPGHNFLVETPDTVDNVWDHNLGLVTRIANFTEPTLSTQGDAEPANYWIRSAKNTFTRNVAGGSLAHGYWFDATAEGGLVFRDNVAHSSLGNATDDPTQKAKIDFNRESGLFVQAVVPDVSEPDPARPWYELLFERTVLFQNSTDMWPQDGAMRFKDSVFPDSPGNAIVGEGCYATFEAPFFAGPSPTTVRSGVPLHLQYSGKLVVLSPTFVGYQGILTSNDIAFPYQADFVIGGATFVDVPPTARSADGFSLVETRDDTFLPKGFYVPGSPALVVGTSTVFTPGAAGDPAVYKNATRLAYATLAFGSGSQSTMAAGGMTATRSDGVAYSGHGQGIDVVTNANYAYRLSRAPANGAFTVRLSPQGSYNQLVSPPAVDDVGAEIAIPLANTPSKVQITGGAALTAAASLVAFRAAPKTSYFYDGASKMLTVRATFTSLSVQP
ncbi:MAG: hypothetical protein JST00_13760 [Deltaproteobacteria bacterium]|nr:hypothetical protein [Deltaproteobacteria bacterium]